MLAYSCGMVVSGHGGARAAEYVKQNLFSNLIRHPKFISDTKSAIGLFPDCASNVTFYSLYEVFTLNTTVLNYPLYMQLMHTSTQTQNFWNQKIIRIEMLDQLPPLLSLLVTVCWLQMLGTPELLSAGVVMVRSSVSFLFLEIFLCIRVSIVILNLEEHLCDFQTDFYWMLYPMMSHSRYCLVRSWEWCFMALTYFQDL